jgi:hypothetical protein
MIAPIGVALGVLVLIAARTRQGFVRLLAITAGIPIGTALFLGGQSVSLFYMMAIGIVIAAALRLAADRPRMRSPMAVTERPRRLNQLPGATALAFFVGWAILVTIAAPTLFRGQPVLRARGGLDVQLLDPGRLDYNISNLAQIIYLVLNVAVIGYLARQRHVGGLVGIALGTLTILSFWRLLGIHIGLPFPEGVFDNSRNVRYIESAPGGGQRFRGIVSEPSSLGEMSLTAIVYFVAWLPRLRGVRRIAATVLLLMALVNGLVSTSTTFVAAGIVVAAAAIVAGFVGFTLRRSNLSPVFFVVLCLCVIGAILLAPMAAQLVRDVLAEKVASTSYASRSGVDIFSMRLAAETWGIGTGLGSNRASSGVTTLLSCVGVPGTVAFGWFVTTMLVRSWRHPAVRPTAWAVIALLISKAIAGPTVLDPLMTLCLGVLAAVAWRRPLRFQPAAVGRVGGQALRSPRPTPTPESAARA